MKILGNIKKLSLVTIVLSLIFGVLFIAFPAQCKKYAALFLGVGLILVGAYSIVKYFVKQSSVLLLTLGIIVAICGIIVCIKYEAIISFILILFGIFILTSGIVDLITGLRTVFTYKVFGFITIALSIATIIFGIYAITKSTALSESLIQLTGVALIVYSVLDTIAFFEVKKIASNVKSAVDQTVDNGDIVTDATIIED